MSLPKPEESFCCAYWDFLRGIVALEPFAGLYGLSELDAQVLRNQCYAEWKRLNPVVRGQPENNFGNSMLAHESAMPNLKEV